jgi:hypothetical protein
MDGKNGRPTRTRWSLVLLRIVTALLVIVGGYRVYRANLFTLHARDGRSLCRVEAGWSQEEVATHCGPATGRGVQPKVTASGGGFVPKMCSAPGDVYGTKVVLYGCDGRVESIERMPAQGFVYPAE